MKGNTTGWILTSIVLFAGAAALILGMAAGFFVLVISPNKSQPPPEVAAVAATQPVLPANNTRLASNSMPPATFTPLPKPLPRPIEKSRPDTAGTQSEPVIAPQTGVASEIIPTDTPPAPSPTRPPVTPTSRPQKAQPAATNIPPSPTATATATQTPAPTDTPSPTATETTPPTATATPTPSAGQLSGQLLLNDAPAQTGITIWLEDASATLVAQTSTIADGRFVIEDIPADGQPYTLIFNNQDNSNQLEMEQIVSWGWLGPIAITNGQETVLPAMELSLLGFAPTVPAPNTTVAAADLSAADPLIFRWESYPDADAYWVDIVRGEGQAALWQSTAGQDTSCAFDGLIGSDAITPGEYWWGIGAHRTFDGYTLTVYSYLSEFTIAP